MEVIVDDSQLSLAIGKKGQNVRLAAKLLGWKIDIKSEEEKRQEVETAMAALVAPGAPVSVLIDYGLPETVAEALVGAGVGTIEKLGAMTPEQLEETRARSGPVEFIQAAVVAYYSRSDPGTEAGAAQMNPASQNPVKANANPANPRMPANRNQAKRRNQGTGQTEEPGEAPREPAEALSAEAQESVEQFGTIENAGSLHDRAEAGAE
jgi:N utilization substance protein A